MKNPSSETSPTDEPSWPDHLAMLGIIAVIVALAVVVLNCHDLMPLDP